MKHLLFITTFLLSTLGFAAGTKTLQGDTWKSANLTKTWTPPSTTQTLVGTTSTDTLTNKTISGASNTITGLSLTTAVTGTLPIANGGTNNGSLAVTAGGALYTDGTKVVNVGAGTSGQFLKSNGASAPAWSSVSVTNSVASKTSNYTLLTSDFQINGDASGGAFTLTLPTAVGNTGKEFVLFRTDQTFANIITIATTGGQTINGVSTKTLATQYESWRLISDGANWLVLEHKSKSTILTYTPTFVGLGTVTDVLFNTYRDGIELVINGRYRAGTPTASIVTVSLPTGLNSTFGLAVDASSNYAPVGTTSRNVVLASFCTIIAPVNSNLLYVGAYTASTYSPVTPLGGADFTLANDYIVFNARVPIANWTE